MAVELDHNGLSGLMPDMSDDQFEELVQDIKANGLIEALQLDAEGKLLDGRHREKACIAAGRTVKTKPWRGPANSKAYIQYIASENLFRRHLTPKQRADAAGELIAMAQRRGDKTIKRTATAVATMADVSASTAKRSVRRSRAASKPPITRTPSNEPPKPTDKAGNTLPDDLIGVFEQATFYRDCIAKLKAVEDAVVTRCVAQDPSTTFVTIADLQSAIKTARDVLRFAIPYVVCPFCEGLACDRCNKSGWMPRALYKRADVPDDLRYDKA